MSKMYKWAGLFITCLVVAACGSSNSALSDEPVNRATFYNTYGYINDAADEWIVPMKIYLHDRRRSIERFTTSLASRRYSLDDDERDRFRARIAGIVANSESRERVGIVFDNDTTETTYYVRNEEGRRLRTDLNGRIEGKIYIPAEKASYLLEAQESENGWLSFRAESYIYTGTGSIQLIPPTGLSVISDIDDTIKITEIPAGSRVMVRNTFFKEFTAAPGMARFYNQMEGATFHYVSGSPWQLYRPLEEFLFSDEAGFPKGTFHMKNVRKNIFNLNTWRDLRELVTNEYVTLDQKIGQITVLFEQFPNREFILVGDSGERDPEVYREIQRLYPDQIRDIIIRDVINARELDPDRLEGFTVIQARTVLPGISQFDEE